MIAFSRTTQRAFTLLETMIVIALASAMMVTLGFLIYHFGRSVAYQQTLSRSSDSASALMREIGSLVLPANAVRETHVFSGGTYTSASTSLVLEIPSIDSSGNVIAGTYDYAAFYVAGTHAYRLLQANASSKRTSGTKLLSSTVYALTFSYNDTDFTKVSSTTVDIQTRAYAKQDTLSDHRREQFRLRNY